MQIPQSCETWCGHRPRGRRVLPELPVVEQTSLSADKLSALHAPSDNYGITLPSAFCLTFPETALYIAEHLALHSHYVRHMITYIFA